MNLLFDLGGTHFRYYILDDNTLIYQNKDLRNDDILKQLNKCLNEIFLIYKITDIKVSIAGIVNNYQIFGCMNAGINNGNKLLKSFNNINLFYINDGDASLLGELYFNDIDYKNKNILNLIFGTGVGCGLMIDGKLMKNSEIHKFIEPFMKKNYLTENNLDLVTSFLSEELSKFIELLNLDYIIINGYVKNYNKFKSNFLKKLNYNEYFQTNIIFSNCENPIFLGLKNY